MSGRAQRAVPTNATAVAKPETSAPGGGKPIELAAGLDRATERSCCSRKQMRLAVD